MDIRTVLVFEEKPKAKDLLLQLLHRQKMKVIYVETLTSALHYLHASQIDAVFSEEKGIETFTPFHIPTFSLSNCTKKMLERFISQLVQKKHNAVIAESAVMKELLKKGVRIAQSEANVFIMGESGTGKEVLAHYIHSHSKRKNTPFIQVNCAAIPETLLESEFFGHVRGAFTGAISDRTGRFEMADTGTLLLDEVTEIPLNLQAKLLRAIQEQEFEKIGSPSPTTVSIRFIATSNRDIEQAIKKGDFREDLFYRLGVIPLHIPPLRERIEDIIPLARYFLKLACKKNHLEEKTLSDHVLSKLKRYRWPGNVRELSNVIEHAAVLSENHVIEYLPIAKQPSSLYPYSNLSLKEIEQLHIQHILHMCNNNKTQAAKKLGISIRTLRNKLN